VDALIRIKRLVIAQRVQFTVKANEERLRHGLSVEEVLESIVNANAIKKVIRSRSPSRARLGERLYVIESPTFTGTWVYTKGVTGRVMVRRPSMSSFRRSSPPSRTQRAITCPICGARRLSAVVQDVVLRVRGRRFVMRDVPHEHCAACGERILNIDTSRRMDAVVLGRRRGRVA
jgi:YgiT-type zinc finger domain-containing protein